MSKNLTARLVALCLALGIIAVTVAGCGSQYQPSPTHVAAMYADALDHGDFRQACQKIQQAIIRRLWRKTAGCETYFVGAFGFGITFGMRLGGYKVVGHSYQGWREGAVKVARVALTAPDGSLLHVRLVKTRAHGWKIASVGT